MTFCVKNTEISNFWSQIQNFLLFFYWNKICNQTNSRALISDMTIVFSDFSPRLSEKDIFSHKYKNFFFRNKLCFQKNLRVLISHMTMAFSNSNPKLPKQSNFCPKCKHFYFCMKLRILKISMVLISKMTIVFFSNSNLKIPLKNQKFFLFKRNFV